MEGKDGAQRVARWVKDQRAAKGWTQDDLVRTTGLSTSQVDYLENSRGTKLPHGVTRAALEDAFGRPRGTIRAVYDGEPLPGDPTEDGDMTRRVAALEGEIAALRSEIHEVADAVRRRFQPDPEPEPDRRSP